MAKLYQLANDFKVINGWYGSCDADTTCKEFNLENHADKIHAVYEWSSGGVPKKWRFDLIPLLQNFTSLKCGHAYLVILKKGVDSVDIPHFNLSYNGPANYGMHTHDCSSKNVNVSTPTPTEINEPTPSPVYSPSTTPSPTNSTSPTPSEVDDSLNFEVLTMELIELESDERNISPEITGTIEYIELEGGFYGVVTDEEVSYLPVNIQEELGENEGKRITINSSYSKKDDVSIFMWGTLIYASNYEILEEITDDDTGGMTFQIENSRVYGFSFRAKTETGYLETDEGEELILETETDELNIEGEPYKYIKSNLPAIKFFELRTLPTRSFDKETCTFISRDKVFRYPVFKEKVKDVVKRRYIASNVSSLLTEFKDEDTHDSFKMNTFIGEYGFDVDDIVKFNGDDTFMDGDDSVNTVNKKVRDKLTILMDSVEDVLPKDELEKPSDRLGRVLKRISEPLKNKPNKKLFDEEDLKEYVKNETDENKTDFDDSVKFLFKQIDEDKELKAGVMLDTIRDEFIKDNKGKRISKIKKVDDSKLTEILNKTKDIAKKRDCEFEDTEKHTGPKVWIEPAIKRMGTVRGKVSDWNQPLYYENKGIIPSGEVSNPMNGSYVGFTPNSFKAWCAPTSAAIQLEHLINFYGLKEPRFLNDGYDSSRDINPNLKTIKWDSKKGWGNYLLDGPNHRGNINAPASVKKCETTDFGWFMNTNEVGIYGQQSTGTSKSGTTIEMIWKGLNGFYEHAGWGKSVGLVYHNPNTGGPLGAVPRLFKENPTKSNDGDLTFKAIAEEIDSNRTILASFSGWNIGNPKIGDEVFIQENHDQISFYEMYEYAPFPTNESLGEIYTSLEQNQENAESALGHTVVIYGYIERGAPEDISGGLIDWILVRDNDDSTARNIAIPFNGSWGNSKRSGFDALIATFYVRPNKSVFVHPCPKPTTPIVTTDVTFSVSEPTMTSDDYPFYKFNIKDREIDIKKYVFVAGKTYVFKRSDEGHAFNIRTSPSETTTDENWKPEENWIRGSHILKGEYIMVKIPVNYDGELWYQCSAHPDMKFELTISTFVGCTKDLRICPDGKAYGRDAENDCKFPICGFDKEKFLDDYTNWKSKNITNYKFDFRWSMYALDEVNATVTIHVENEKIVKIQRKSMNGVLTDITEDTKIKYYSISGLYDYILKEAEESPFVLDVKINDEYIPMGCHIDRDPAIADEEVSFIVSNFDQILTI